MAGIRIPTARAPRGARGRSSRLALRGDSHAFEEVHRVGRGSRPGLASIWPASAQTTPAPAPPTLTQHETIQVTATRVPEDVLSTPASVTVISGEDLVARGVTDLASALSLVAGVNVAPGGDGGPAGSVPEIWGLREFDAFLLVVDGVPWGGAFNPALPSLDLTNVERIEVLRGSAPVMYGATSFVGVIHVIHHAAGDAKGSATVGVRNHGGGIAAVVLPLGARGGLQQSLTVNGERMGYDDDRAGYDRGHLLYRATADTAAGAFRFDADVAVTRQDPSSPHPREGGSLSSRVPLDANHQPKDAHVDEDRLHLVAGLDRRLGDNPWTSTLAVTHTRRDLTRGFLGELDDGADPNAAGFRQDQTQTDLYFDSHLVFHPTATLQLIAGVDLLYGKGKSAGDNVDYHVNLDGSGAQDSHAVPVQESPSLEDERTFAGLYLQGEWTPAPRWRVEAGLRLNETHEDQEGEVESEDGEERSTSSAGNTRASGVVGVSLLAWDGGGGDAVWAYADYRNTFKPAAVDFGPEAEGGILDPETATSVEAGLKGAHGGGRWRWQASVFRLDFDNLVTAAEVGGLPVLINAGAGALRRLRARGRGAAGPRPAAGRRLQQPRRPLPRLRPGLRRRAHPAPRPPPGDVGQRPRQPRPALLAGDRIRRPPGVELRRRPLPQQAQHGAGRGLRHGRRGDLLPDLPLHRPPRRLEPGRRPRSGRRERAGRLPVLPAAGTELSVERDLEVLAPRTPHRNAARPRGSRPPAGVRLAHPRGWRRRGRRRAF